MAARLQSVDALRGLTVAAMLLVNNPGDWNWVFEPLRHAEWHGFTVTDLIFPLFLFVAGVSLELSLQARSTRGPRAVKMDAASDGTLSLDALRASKFARFAPMLWRGLKLIALGLALNLAIHLAFDTAHMRIPGVLQRIGVCVIAVAAIALFLPVRMRWSVTAGLLIGYGAGLAMDGSLAPDANIVSWIDTQVFGPFAYVYDAQTGVGHDPEGLLGTLGAIATTLLGLIAGSYLRRREIRKLFIMTGALLLLGWLWEFVLPFNKNLWTPSFVLWTAGWSTLALLELHLLIDRRGWPAWGAALGRNAILVYAGSIALVCVLAATGLLQSAYETLFASWLLPLAGPYAASLGFAVGHVALWWLVAVLLDRAGWYWEI